MTIDLLTAAQNACDEIGVIFQEVPADGDFHYLDVGGKPPRNGAGRIKLFPDGEGGMVWNHTKDDGYRLFWVTSDHSLTPAELAERKKRVKEERKRVERELVAERQKAAKLAHDVLTAAQLPDNNAYLLRKQVKPTKRLRQIELDALVEIIGYHPQVKGELLSGEWILIVPVGRRDLGITTVEMIDEAGRKPALYGGLKKGCYWSTGLPDGDGTGLTIGIGEGVATMLTFYMATDCIGIAALSCGNLKTVAQYIQGRYPSARFIIVSDVGHGEKAAIEAARTINALLVKPTFAEGSEGTDINDLYIESGLDAVRLQIEAAVMPHTTPEPGTEVYSDQWQQAPPIFETMEEEQSPPDPPLDWPKLSQVALPGLLGEFVQAACKNSEADPAAVAATFLVRFGIECGAGSYYMTGETRHAARLNAVIVGESSKARKGTSAGPVKAVFTELESGCRTSPGPLSSGEGIINAVRDEQRAWVIDKKTKSGEWQVIDPGVDDKRLFILDEEFANALNATKREGNTLSSIIRGLFDDGNASPLTKFNRIETTGAHVGIVTHTTNAELKIKLTENEQLNGFGNRFLWICARRQGVVPFPEQIPDQVKQSIRDLVQERLQHAFRGGEYQFNKEARELWITEYPRLSMAHKGLAGCMVNRAEALVVRLALIYALLSLNNKIARDDLEAALAFWSYCQQSAFYLFGTELEDRRKRKILNTLKPLYPHGLTKTEITNGIFKKHITSESLTALLDEMLSEHLIEIVMEQTGGAPRHIVILKN